MSSLTKTLAAPVESYPIDAIRAQFPILDQSVHGRPLVYLDNAASTQRPLPVLEAIHRFETTDYSNVHRGIHTLSQRATEAYEAARSTVASALNASDPTEIVFVRGTTEGINLVAQSYGRAQVGSGDEVVVTAMEHHSNLVPWQMLCQENGAQLRVAPIDERGDLDLAALGELLGARTRIVAVTHVSNALGTVNPIGEIARMAHDVGAVVVVDGAQGVPHGRVDVRALGVDFYAFSGHKAYAPSGIGALYARRSLLDTMPPWQGGGQMITSVTFESTQYAEPPFKFEAGTPNITGAIGMAAALDYLHELGLDRITEHESKLLDKAQTALTEIPGVTVLGTARHKASVLSFVLDGIHAHDVGSLLDQNGVAVRAGHHCAQPLLHLLGVAATSRASFGIYNTMAEVDTLVSSVREVQEFFDR